jgi:hypothetical protein
VNFPNFSCPQDLAGIESVPLAECDLPASTYELPRRSPALGSLRRRSLPYSATAWRSSSCRRSIMQQT